MRVLAIDPGTNESAFVVWDGHKVFERGQTINENMLAICSDIDSIGGVVVNQLVIEMIYMGGMPAGKETFETCVWIGRFQQASPIGAIRVERHKIKMHHCGTQRAKDSNIRQALIDKYGPPGTKKNPGLTYGLSKHLWQAFALATYITETANQPKLSL